MADKWRRNDIQADRKTGRSRTVFHNKPQTGSGGRRPRADRRVERTGCRNPETRKRIGGVIFALGVPTAIAGIVMTVVDATDNENDKKYPPIFSVIGPIIITIAIILFVVGIFLSTSLISNATQRCFSFDDPKSFCRVHFPRLSQCLHPDDTIAINTAALNALRTEPGKSALKRPPAPPADMLMDPQEGTPLQMPAGYQTPVSLTNIDIVSELKLNSSGPSRAVPRGVHFSDSDPEGDTNRTRLPSAASDNSSVRSVRHCKVYPKDDGVIWHTEDKTILQTPQPASQTLTAEL